MKLLDFLFPKRCVACKKLGEYICASCFSSLSFDVKLLCVVCNKPSFDGITHPRCRGRYTIDGVFSSVVYGFVIRRLLYQYKYQPYVSDIASLISTLSYEGLIQQEAFMNVLQIYSPVMMPIPLHTNKFRKRGFNQAALLGEKLAKIYGLEYADILIRKRETKPQYGLKQDERKENMKDAFAIDKEKRKGVGHTEVFLVDDLLTSGSTMYEAAKILKKAGFEKVWGVTFARDQRE